MISRPATPVTHPVTATPASFTSPLILGRAIKKIIATSHNGHIFPTLRPLALLRRDTITSLNTSPYIDDILRAIRVFTESKTYKEVRLIGPNGSGKTEILHQIEKEILQVKQLPVCLISVSFDNPYHDASLTLYDSLNQVLTALFAHEWANNYASFSERAMNTWTKTVAKLANNFPKNLFLLYSELEKVPGKEEKKDWLTKEQIKTLAENIHHLLSSIDIRQELAVKLPETPITYSEFLQTLTGTVSKFVSRLHDSLVAMLSDTFRPPANLPDSLIKEFKKTIVKGKIITPLVDQLHHSLEFITTGTFAPKEQLLGLLGKSLPFFFNALEIVKHYFGKVKFSILPGSETRTDSNNSDLPAIKYSLVLPEQLKSAQNDPLQNNKTFLALINFLAQHVPVLIFLDGYHLIGDDMFHLTNTIFESLPDNVLIIKTFPPMTDTGSLTPQLRRDIQRSHHQIATVSMKALTQREIKEIISQDSRFNWIKGEITLDDLATICFNESQGSRAALSHILRYIDDQKAKDLSQIKLLLRKAAQQIGGWNTPQATEKLAFMEKWETAVTAMKPGDIRKAFDINFTPQELKSVSAKTLSSEIARKLVCCNLDVLTLLRYRDPLSDEALTAANTAFIKRLIATFYVALELDHPGKKLSVLELNPTVLKMVPPFKDLPEEIVGPICRNSDDPFYTHPVWLSAVTMDYGLCFKFSHPPEQLLQLRSKVLSFLDREDDKIRFLALIAERMITDLGIISELHGNATMLLRKFYAFIPFIPAQWLNQRHEMAFKNFIATGMRLLKMNNSDEAFEYFLRAFEMLEKDSPSPFRPKLELNDDYDPNKVLEVQDVLVCCFGLTQSGWQAERFEQVHTLSKRIETLLDHMTSYQTQRLNEAPNLLIRINIQLNIMRTYESPATIKEFEKSAKKIFKLVDTFSREKLDLKKVQFIELLTVISAASKAKELSKVIPELFNGIEIIYSDLKTLSKEDLENLASIIRQMKYEASLPVSAELLPVCAVKIKAWLKKEVKEFTEEGWHRALQVKKSELTSEASHSSETIDKSAQEIKDNLGAAIRAVANDMVMKNKYLETLCVLSPSLFMAGDQRILVFIRNLFEAVEFIVKHGLVTREALYILSLFLFAIGPALDFYKASGELKGVVKTSELALPAQTILKLCEFYNKPDIYGTVYPILGILLPFIHEPDKWFPLVRQGAECAHSACDGLTPSLADLIYAFHLASNESDPRVIIEKTKSLITKALLTKYPFNGWNIFGILLKTLQMALPEETATQIMKQLYQDLLQLTETKDKISAGDIPERALAVLKDSHNQDSLGEYLVGYIEYLATAGEFRQTLDTLKKEYIEKKLDKGREGIPIAVRPCLAGFRAYAGLLGRNESVKGYKETIKKLLGIAKVFSDVNPQNFNYILLAGEAVVALRKKDPVTALAKINQALTAAKRVKMTWDVGTLLEIKLEIEQSAKSPDAQTTAEALRVYYGNRYCVGKLRDLKKMFPDVKPLNT